MMRRLVLAFALVASFALDASVVEAATTSEKEGRKFSRKYIKKEDGQIGYGPDWVQRDCYRIGPGGVGRHRVAPRGVVCMFSNIEDGGAKCYIIAVGVKDTKRFVSAEVVPPLIPYHRLGDPADCEPDSPGIEWPDNYWNGVVGDPL
jgi:hypothetical protein